jgi:hypothetical protein
MILRRTILVTAVVASSAMMSGCVALAVGAAGGAAGAVYVKGRVVDKVDAPVERVYNATLSMLGSKDLPVLEKRVDIASANVRSEYSNDDDIRIEIEAITSEVSEIRVRVGLTGDQDRSLDLLEGIKSRL